MIFFIFNNICARSKSRQTETSKRNETKIFLRIHMSEEKNVCKPLGLPANLWQKLESGLLINGMIQYR